MDESYSRKELIIAIGKNRIYDYIANHYHEMSKYDLKEVLLAVLGVCYDNCSDEASEEKLMTLLSEELANRDFTD